MWTAIITLIILARIGFILAKIIKNKKKGKCASGCAGCSGCGNVKGGGDIDDTGRKLQ